MNTPQLFNGATVSKSLKSGAEAIRPMNRKEFKESKGLTNAEAKRLFPDYLRECGIVANTAIAAKMTAGEIVCQAVTIGKEGEIRAKFLPASHKSFVAPESKGKVAGLEKRLMELEAELAEAKRALAK